MGGGTQVVAVLPDVSVVVAEIAVEEEEGMDDNLEVDGDEDAARVVRLLAGDDARASISRAMVRAMLLLLLPLIVDGQQRRVLMVVFLLIMIFVIVRYTCELKNLSMSEQKI